MKPCCPFASCTRLSSRSALVALLALPAFAAFGAPELAAQSSADNVSATRSTVEKWVDTRDLIAKETRDWTLQKEALAARGDIVKRDIVALQKRIAEAESNLADADKKRLELVVDNDKRKASVAALEQRIVALEERARRLLPRLPDPVRERVALLSQRLPKAGEATKLQLSDRFANVVGVLNELHKWNREITVTSELRQLPDGQSVEVAVLYIGLGQAFYTGGNGKVGGVGTATTEGWVWRPANEQAAAIQRTIAIWKNEQVAAFVHLPIKVM